MLILKILIGKMIKILFSQKVVDFIELSNSDLKKQIKKKFKNLYENPLLGDYIFGIENIDCRGIKVKGLRFFTIQYRNQNFILNDSEFKNIVKIVDIARKNKSKEQQKIIDDIKKKVKSFGIDF